MVADEGLGEPHVIDQLGHRRRRLGQAPDDPEPVHVGERPVECAELAQVVGLVDDRGQGSADPGRRRGQDELPAGSRRVRDRADRLNTRLYKGSLILISRPRECQGSLRGRPGCRRSRRGRPAAHRRPCRVSEGRTGERDLPGRSERSGSRDGSSSRSDSSRASRPRFSWTSRTCLNCFASPVRIPSRSAARRSRSRRRSRAASLGGRSISSSRSRSRAFTRRRVPRPEARRQDPGGSASVGGRSASS